MNNSNDIRYMLFAYLNALWKYRFLVLVIMLSTPVVGIIASYFIPSKYQTSTAIATSNTIPSFIKEVSSVSDLEQQFPGLKAYIVSPYILQKVAIQVGWLKQNDSEIKTQGVIQDMAKMITVTLFDKNLVEIKIVGGSPKDLTAVLNNLSAIFMSEYLKPIIISAQSASILLNKELEEQKKKLNESISELNKFKSENNRMLPDYEKIYGAQLQQINMSMVEADARYKTALEEKKLMDKTLAHSTPEILNVEREINANELNLNSMKQIYTDDYPGIKAAQELNITLRKERDKLYKNLTNLKNKLPSESSVMPDVKTSLNNNDLTSAQISNYLAIQQKIDAYEGQMKVLNEQKNQLIETLKKVGDTDNKLNALTKTVTENQQLYNDMLKRYNLAKMATQMDYKNDFSPIKMVAAPLEPIFNMGRSMSFCIFVAFLGGLFASLGLVFILDALDTTVRKRHGVESLSGFAVIARIGKIG